MSTTTQRALLTMGVIALRVGVMESKLRDFLRTARPYTVRAGRMTLVAEDDLPLLAADLRAAGLLADDHPAKEIQ